MLRFAPLLPLLAPGLALAQQPAPAPQPPCAFERAVVAAEATTPGILQRLAAESLAACLAQAERPAATTATR